MEKYIPFAGYFEGRGGCMKMGKCALAAIMAIVVFIGCSDGNDDTVAVTGVTLNETALTLPAGDTKTLIATVSPSHASNKNVTWKSSDETKATVDNGGKVTARAEGTATITVTTQDGGKTTTCNVTVTPAAAPKVAVIGVTLNEDEIEIAEGHTAFLTATVAPANASNKKVTWESSDESKATVTVNAATGVATVRGGAEGTATVTVTTADGGFEETCEVTVIYVAVASVTLSRDALPLTAGSTATLAATVLPANATNKKVTWESSDESKATVTVNTATGVATVRGVAVGEASITVTSNIDSTKTDSCTVTISPVAVTGVTLTPTTLSMAVGGSKTFTANVLPANATNKTVTWESNAPGVATVEDGTVTGVAVGTATITVTTEDGGKTATRNVSVYLGMIENMVPIQAGTFLMGSPDNEPERVAIDGYETQHSVMLTQGFYMGKYQVTQKQYKDVTGENDSAFPGSDSLYEDRWEEFPVEWLNWYEAIIFCNRLSMQEGFSPAYSMYKSAAPNANNNPQDNVTNWNNSANWSTNPADWGSIPWSDNNAHNRWSRVRWVEGSDGYRLPTEAEWEYACRADTTTPFNTGDNITTDQANYNGRYPYNGNAQGEFLVQTVPVGMYQPNAWGLYDMHGNVSEWCWDWFDYYGNGADTDPKGPTYPCTHRIIRGGSWFDHGLYLRSAFRDGNQPYNYVYLFSEGLLSSIGFRIVRNAPSSPDARTVMEYEKFPK
jgi:uncharacterized protein YjdB